MNKDLKPKMIFVNYGKVSLKDLTSEEVKELKDLFNKYYSGNLEFEDSDNHVETDDEWLAKNIKDI